MRCHSLQATASQLCLRVQEEVQGSQQGGATNSCSQGEMPPLRAAAGVMAAHVIALPAAFLAQHVPCCRLLPSARLPTHAGGCTKAYCTAEGAAGWPGCGQQRCGATGGRGCSPAACLMVLVHQLLRWAGCCCCMRELWIESRYKARMEVASTAAWPTPPFAGQPAGPACSIAAAARDCTSTMYVDVNAHNEALGKHNCGGTIADSPVKHPVFTQNPGCVCCFQLQTSFPLSRLKPFLEL